MPTTGLVEPVMYSPTLLSQICSSQPQAWKANFWGCERFLPEFPQKVFEQLFVRIFPPTQIMNTVFWDDLKQSLHMILHTLGANFPFIFRYCANISRIFDKSQLLDVRFHPRPTLLFTTICTIPKYVSCFLISFLLTFNLFFSCLVYFFIELV